MSQPIPRLHLIAIGLALCVLAAGTWFYSTANEPVAGLPETANRLSTAPTGPTTPEACEKAGGVWNECASACPPGAEACVQMCVKKCEFAPAGGLGTFNIYFPNARLGSDKDCGKVFPVQRAAHGDADLFGELLKGPTKEELAQGYSTAIPEGVKFLSSTVRAPDSSWFLNFSKELGKAAGACRVTAIRAQIERSLRESVPESGKIYISVDGGDPDEALQP